MKLWLDDIRDPNKFALFDFEWAKTYEKAIELLKTGNVTFASLDHDLSTRATLGLWDGEKTGYDLLCWMEANDIWPKDGIVVHSYNPAGRERMFQVLKKAVNNGKIPYYSYWKV